MTMAIGLVITGGAIAMFATTVGSSRSSIMTARLQQELRTIMNIMANDVRRAGSWGNASGTLGALNPFIDTTTAGSTTDLMVFDADNNIVTNGSGDCVVYSYDFDRDGTVDTVTPIEFYGFRRISQNHELSMLTAGSTTDSCTAGTWQAIHDVEVIEITTLTFVNTNYACINLTNAADAGCAAPASGDITQTIRQIDITLTGRLTGDTSISRTLNETVRVRNDQIVETP